VTFFAQNWTSFGLTKSFAIIRFLSQYRFKKAKWTVTFSKHSLLTPRQAPHFKCLLSLSNNLLHDYIFLVNFWVYHAFIYSGANDKVLKLFILKNGKNIWRLRHKIHICCFVAKIDHNIRNNLFSPKIGKICPCSCCRICSIHFQLKAMPTKMTSLGDFSPIGLLFTLGCFFNDKNSPNCLTTTNFIQ
jgi:hypothetical protein